MSEHLRFFMALEVLTFEFAQNLRTEFAQAGFAVAYEEWRTISQLQDLPGMTTTDLAERRRRDKTTITRMIDRLVAKGLVERRADPKDRRAHRLFLSRTGYETSAELAAIAAGLADRMVADLDPVQVSVIRSATG